MAPKRTAMKHTRSHAQPQSSCAAAKAPARTVKSKSSVKPCASRVAVPMPRFSAETPYGGEHEVACFWGDGCTTTRKTYLSLMTHMLQAHTELKIPPAWKGTYFAIQATAEKTQKQTDRKRKAKSVGAQQVVPKSESSKAVQ